MFPVFFWVFCQSVMPTNLHTLQCLQCSKDKNTSIYIRVCMYLGTSLYKLFLTSNKIIYLIHINFSFNKSKWSNGKKNIYLSLSVSYIKLHFVLYISITWWWQYHMNDHIYSSSLSVYQAKGDEENLPTYLPTYLPTHLPTYLLSFLPIYLPTWLPTNLPMPTYLPAYLQT